MRGSLSTALYEGRIKNDHPKWGIGVATRLRLPFIDKERHNLANHFNVMECSSPDSHQLGAWSVLGDALTFASFFPLYMFAGGDQNSAHSLFATLAWHQAARARWANTLHAPVSGSH